MDKNIINLFDNKNINKEIKKDEVKSSFTTNPINFVNPVIKKLLYNLTDKKNKFKIKDLLR